MFMFWRPFTQWMAALPASTMDVSVLCVRVWAWCQLIARM
jgi:hypothetical protein